MVCFVTGSNIFGQWSREELVINAVRVITESKHESSTPMKLRQINWSYNILQIDDEFYISGFWNGQEKQFVKIPLPDDYTGSKDGLIVIGNDYNLLLVSKYTNQLWLIDINMKNKPKKINFNTEEPIEDIEKRQKRDVSISKAVLINDCCLFLTSIGHVYSGILPTYVDTRHCRGNVSDVQCGYEHYMLLTDRGIVYTWGNGRRLQLGHGEISNLEIPMLLEALDGIKITKISCGGWHSLALSEFGDLYAWGWNDMGQLGIKHDVEQSYPVPTLVDLFNNNGEEVGLNVKDIACGSRHSAIILEDSSVWTTGCNKYGQLGFSEQKYSSVSHFRKSFHCDTKCILLCGPWTTVIDSS